MRALAIDIAIPFFNAGPMALGDRGVDMPPCIFDALQHRKKAHDEGILFLALPHAELTM